MGTTSLNLWVLMPYDWHCLSNDVIVKACLTALSSFWIGLKPWNSLPLSNYLVFSIFIRCVVIARCKSVICVVQGPACFEAELALGELCNFVNSKTNFFCAYRIFSTWTLFGSIWKHFDSWRDILMWHTPHLSDFNECHAGRWPFFKLLQQLPSSSSTRFYISSKSPASPASL